MNVRRFACLLLGAWLAVGATVTLITFENSRLIDHNLAHLSPSAAARVKALGQEQVRSLYMLQATEQNHFYLETWGTAQVVVGIACLFFVLFATREGKTTLLVAAVILLIVILQRVLIVPEISSLTRLLQAEPAAADRHRLYLFLWINRAVEGVKLLIGLGIAGQLLLQGRRHSRHAGQQVDVIDKPDYGHVYR